jgi:hypothetical protein
MFAGSRRDLRAIECFPLVWAVTAPPAGEVAVAAEHGKSLGIAVPPEPLADVPGRQLIPATMLRACPADVLDRQEFEPPFPAAGARTPGRIAAVVLERGEAVRRLSRIAPLVVAIEAVPTPLPVGVDADRPTALADPLLPLSLAPALLAFLAAIPWPTPFVRSPRNLEVGRRLHLPARQAEFLRWLDNGCVVGPCEFRLIRHDRPPPKSVRIRQPNCSANSLRDQPDFPGFFGGFRSFPSFR